MKSTKFDMNTDLNSLILTTITLYLYVSHKYIIPTLIIDANLKPIILKIINDGVIGIFVLLSAVSTGVLNMYKFWQLWKENKKSKQPKTPPHEQ